jgi:hypothetical protein
LESLAGDCIKLLLEEPDLRAVGFPDGVWVGWDVSKVLGGFVANQKPHQGKHGPPEIAIRQLNRETVSKKYRGSRRQTHSTYHHLDPRIAAMNENTTDNRAATQDDFVFVL